MVDVIFTNEFDTWYEAQIPLVKHRLNIVLTVLADYGIAAPFPYSSKLTGSKYNLRELRTAVNRRAYRLIYTFDPSRNAVILLGGDKSGEKHWYEKAIAQSEIIYEKYLAGEQYASFQRCNS